MDVVLLGAYSFKRDLLSASPIITASTVILIIDLLLGDKEAFIAINSGLASPILDIACGYLSTTLFSASIILSLIRLYLKRNGGSESKAMGLIAATSAPICYILGSALKVLIGRLRPFEALESVRIVGIWHTSTFSFPSTTTMFAFGFALPIFYGEPRLGLLLICAASFIGFSVIYTGFHYPADVIVGVLLSTLITLLTNRVRAKVEGFISEWKR